MIVQHAVVQAITSVPNVAELEKLTTKCLIKRKLPLSGKTDEGSFPFLYLLERMQYYEIFHYRLYFSSYYFSNNRHNFDTLEAGKEVKTVAALFLALSKIAVESFLSGATAAITLYCGVKTPRNRRK